MKETTAHGGHMAFELKNWKQPGCSATLKTGNFSRREEFSREINQSFGGGGGLNANYRTVEAVARAANVLGKFGLEYGTDFVWKTAQNGEFSLDFLDPQTKHIAMQMLASATIVT